MGIKEWNKKRKQKNDLKDLIKQRAPQEKRKEIKFIIDNLDKLDKAINKAREVVVKATKKFGDAIGIGEQEKITNTRKEREDKKETLSFLKEEMREIIREAKWDFPKDFRKLSFKY